MDSKVLVKEDFTPTGADAAVFTIAPIVTFLAAILSLLVIPFAPGLVGLDMNIGLLYFFGVSGLSVVGLMAGGWSSFNKYSLLGGLRAAAQIVSYELPLVLAPVGVIMLAGTLSLNQIVAHQSGWIWDWYVFQQPLAFVVFFIAATAEGNRTPFDLSEADSEIVAGFATEYSGMRFGFFFFAEYVGVFVLSALATVLFFGGWNSPIDPRPILDFLHITINPALDLAGMGIWLLWTLVIGIPLVILLLAIPIWVTAQRLVIPQVARGGLPALQRHRGHGRPGLGLPVVRSRRRPVLVPAQGIRVRLRIRLDARYAAPRAH